MPLQFQKLFYDAFNQGLAIPGLMLLGRITMKLRVELGASLPETVRISTEWRVAFRLSRYAAEINEVTIKVLAPSPDGQRASYQCDSRVRIWTDTILTAHEAAEQPTIAISAAIDRLASAISRSARRRIRHLEHQRITPTDHTEPADQSE